jgi:hypothetical protein
MADADTPQTPPERTLERGPDGGPLYTETPQEIREGKLYPGTIAEPWNAATAFLFVVIVVTWLIRLRGRLKDHPFLAVALPILLVGGIGGTLYHGLRNWRGFFLMDVIPISLLALMVSIYYWIRLGPKLHHLLSMLAALALIQAFGFWQLPRDWAINVSYALLGLVVLIPLAVVLIRTRFREVGWIATALVSFGIALFCRLADAWQPPLLPMGTHWLWHTFGAITTAALSEYVYRLEGLNLRKAPSA